MKARFEGEKMVKNKFYYSLIVCLMVIPALLSSCAPTKPTSVVEETPLTEEANMPTKQESVNYKFAVLFAGTTKDGGWNTSGFEAAEAVNALENWEMSYSERIEVADLARVIDEYAGTGYAAIWAHGAQFTSTIVDSLADQYPNVSFIVEGDGPNETAAAKNNVKYLDRNHTEAVYPLGYTAALWTKTNKVAYIGALPLPYVWASIRTIEKSFIDAGKENIELIYLMTGDFNDPVKGKQATETMIAQGVDFVIGELDLAGSGVVQAAEEATNSEGIRVTTSYSIFPNSPNWVTSTLFKPTEQIIQLLKEVEEGKLGGALKLPYGLYGSGKPRSTYLPIQHVPDEINQKVNEICKELEAGNIDVITDFTPIE